MDVELCLRKTHKEESARPEEATNNQFPPGAIHVTVKEIQHTYSRNQVGSKTFMISC